jgi:hypothetical protein
MIDAEVERLRRLRLLALRARAFAVVFAADKRLEDAVFTRSAVTCWRVARVITGHLRAHPFLSYQNGPSPIRALLDRTDALLIGRFARHQQKNFSVYARQLQLLARELDDARALTWSAHLSDTLGRLQIQVRRLLGELGAGARLERGVPQIEAGATMEAGGKASDSKLSGNWPYLAI